jgi:hypothetical protein
MDTCDQSFYVLFTMLWSYYYFEVTSPALGSFFGDSICLTLLAICYPGSIEKLKLLGATYLLTYLLCVFCPFYSRFYTILWYSPLPQTQTVSNLKWEISIRHRSIRFFVWFFVSICQKFFKMEHFDWLKNVYRAIRFFIRDTPQSKNLAYKIPE